MLLSIRQSPGSIPLGRSHTPPIVHSQTLFDIVSMSYVVSLGLFALQNVYNISHLGKTGPTRFELATSCVTGRRSIQSELRPHVLNDFFLQSLRIHYIKILLEVNLQLTLF